MSPPALDTEKLISAAQDLRVLLTSDPFRPVYHFLPPEGWMNDINGAIFHQGRYHIFYQYNPEGAYWKWIQWGHASSPDLIHWTHHPVALKPDKNGPDRDGCFSGGALIDRNGTPFLIYHGVPDGTCIASSNDDLLIHWEKHPGNPVLRTPRPGDPGYDRYVVFDPCVWRGNEVYYALIGNTVPGIVGDATSLFQSPDLIHWEYIGPFYQPRTDWTEPEEDCAVPDFFPLQDQYVLLFNSHLHGTQYYLGQFDGRKFTPTEHGRMTWPGGQLGGERTLLDARGRRIFFDWIRELRAPEQQRKSGWSGVMTLPRILSLDATGELTITPVPELEQLRGRRRQCSDLHIKADTETVLEDIRGNTLELLVEIHPGDAAEFGITLLRSPDAAEQTSIVLTPREKTVKIDISRTSLDESIRYYHYRNDQPVKKAIREVASQDAPFALRPQETYRLHIYLDRSVLEVFVNDRQAVTQRVYPTRRDSTGISLFSRGGDTTVTQIQVWNMAPAF